MATDRLSSALAAIADPTRRAILVRLAEGEATVNELAEPFPISLQAVSQHLKVLKATGLVDDETVGTRRIYRLNPAGVQALRDQLDTFWNRAMANYEAAMDDDPREDET